MGDLKSFKNKNSEVDWDRNADNRIAAAAVLDTITDTVYTMDAPARHHDIVHALAAAGHPQVGTDEQGFITQHGFWLRRKPARAVAVRAKQLLPRARDHSELFSEDVW